MHGRILRGNNAALLAVGDELKIHAIDGTYYSKIELHRQVHSSIQLVKASARVPCDSPVEPLRSCIK